VNFAINILSAAMHSARAQGQESHGDIGEFAATFDQRAANLKTDLAALTRALTSSRYANIPGSRCFALLLFSLLLFFFPFI